MGLGFLKSHPRGHFPLAEMKVHSSGFGSWVICEEQTSLQSPPKTVPQNGDRPLSRLAGIVSLGLRCLLSGSGNQVVKEQPKDLGSAGPVTRGTPSPVP